MPTLNAVDGLAQLSFLVQGTLQRRADERDVSLAQTRLLGILRDRTSSMNELAQLLEVDKSSVTGLVDRAERRGLVVRSPSVTDRRGVQVALTRSGRSLVSKVASAFEADVADLLGHLSAAERRSLSGLISKLLVAHAGERGVDLFPQRTQPGMGATGPHRG